MIYVTSDKGIVAQTVDMSVSNETRAAATGDSEGTERLQPRRVPVDLFLCAHDKGTCSIGKDRIGVFATKTYS